MSNKTNSQAANTRVTVDIPTKDHKKLKMLAAFYEKSMREVLTEILQHGLENYQECRESHEPNAVTRKTIEDARKGIGLEKVESMEEFFKKLRS